MPVRDEEDRLQACLIALTVSQTRPPDRVVVLLNNCTDRSAAIASDMRACGFNSLELIEVTLPVSHASAGHARRLAMQHAARLAHELDDDASVLLTTDADAVVPPNWVRDTLDAVAAGADAVCGQAVIDPVDALEIPAHLHEDDAREVAFDRLLDEIAWHIDPDAADPWPRHTENSGASIAVRRDCFERAGGFPDVASGEDRAFVEKLRQTDARVRHSPLLRVTVSGRIHGRAVGGMADAIRRRIACQDEFTDARLEPADDAVARLRRRGALHDVWRGDNGRAALARDCGISAAALGACLDTPWFGTAWARLQAASPILSVRRRVRFDDVPGEITRAERTLRGILAGRGSGPRSAFEPVRAKLLGMTTEVLPNAPDLTGTA